MVRPGGVIELVESDLLIYDSNHQPIHINTKQPPGPPYLATFMTHVYEALVTSGGDIYAADNLRRWVERHPAFEDVSYSETWLQCVGPMGGEGKEEAEAAMRHNMRVRSASFSLDSLSLIFSVAALHLGVRAVGSGALVEGRGPKTHLRPARGLYTPGD